MHTTGIKLDFFALVLSLAMVAGVVHSPRANVQNRNFDVQSPRSNVQSLDSKGHDAHTDYSLHVDELKQRIKKKLAGERAADRSSDGSEGASFKWIFWWGFY